MKEIALYLKQGIMKKIDTLYIETYTPEVPIPFSYALSIEATNLKEQTGIAFKKEYLGREGLSEEEIIEEGGEPEAVYRWEGAISIKWLEQLEKIIPSLRLHKEEGDSCCFISYIFQEETSNDKKNKGFVENNAVWEYLIQELQQAILEASGKEHPLSIRFISKNEIPLDTTLTANFAQRKVFITKIIGKNKNKEEEIDWSMFQQILDAVFSVEYAPEEAIPEQKLPAKGIFIEPEPGKWFELPTSVTRANKNGKKTEALIALFSAL